MAPTGRLWGSRVPTWGLTLKAKGFHALMGMVAAELKSRGLAFDFGEGVVTVGWAKGSKEIALPPLVDRCETCDREQWQSVVAGYLDEALAQK
jgi:hypothetical protein